MPATRPPLPRAVTHVEELSRSGRQAGPAGQTDRMRIEIHVRPGASLNRVGGTHDGVLLVRVTEAAERGRATNAALDAVAEALGVSRRTVTLVRGASSRRKLIEIATGDDSRVERQIVELRDLLH